MHHLKFPFTLLALLYALYGYGQSTIGLGMIVNNTDFVSVTYPNNIFNVRTGFELNASISKDIVLSNLLSGGALESRIGFSIGVAQTRTAFCCDDPISFRQRQWVPRLRFDVLYRRFSIGLSGHAYLSFFQSIDTKDENIRYTGEPLKREFFGLDGNITYQLFDRWKIRLGYTIFNTHILEDHYRRRNVTPTTYYYRPRMLSLGVEYDLTDVGGTKGAASQK